MIKIKKLFSDKDIKHCSCKCDGQMNLGSTDEGLFPGCTKESVETKYKNNFGKAVMGKDSRFTMEEALFETLIKFNNVSCAKVNLSKNIILKVSGAEGDRLDSSTLITWDDIINKDTKNSVCESDYNDISKTLSRDSLLKAYIRGQQSVSLRHRRLFGDGRVKWVSYLANMATNPITGEVYLYGYVRDADIVIRAELAIDKNPEFCNKSGLYTLDTVKAIAKEIERNCDKDKPVSVFVLELVNKEDNKGKEIGKDAFVFIQQIVKLLLNDRCVVGDIGGNRLVVYIPETACVKCLKDVVSRIISMLKIDDHINYKFDFLVGICTEPMEKMSFDAMLTKAKSELTKAKDYIVIHDDIKEKYSQSSMNAEYGDTKMDVEKANLFARCLEMFQDAQYIDFSVNSVLKELGEYYQSSGCSIIELDEESGTVQVSYKWCREGVKQNEQCFANKHINELPILKKAYEADVPLIIDETDIHENKSEIDSLKELGQSSIIILPFKIDHGVYGFLCVDDPANVDKDTVFVKAISHFIAKELVIKKLRSEQEYVRYYNELTGLMNRRSLSKYLDTFRPDAVYSLGVANGDINNLKLINDQFGITYGNEMLINIAGCIRRHFSKNEVYMYGGDEFLIICENYTYEAFREKIKAVRKEIDSTYPETICLGYTWADTDIDPEKLISNAGELMILDKQSYYEKSDKSNSHYDNKMGKELMTSIKNGEYTVFLQPKAKTEDGKISGAEALVRKLDKDKGIIYPNTFIPVFEKQNIIKYIDLFVFEEVLKVLTAWKNQGKRLIYISLNFSRATLLEPGILDIMDEIHNKYDVERKYVEIEITESMGDMEIETMRTICSSIKNMGYRISLDDFGAKYSSVAMITSMDFDVIKIDKSITNDILENRVNQILMKNIFSACKEIGIETVTEGVETKEQLDLLRDIGCTYAQGYLLNKAIPWKEFEEKYIDD